MLAPGLLRAPCGACLLLRDVLPVGASVASLAAHLAESSKPGRSRKGAQNTLSATTLKIVLEQARRSSSTVLAVKRHVT